MSGVCFGPEGACVQKHADELLCPAVLCCAAFAAVVAIGEAPLTLLVLSALNVIGALSMALAIARTEQPGPASAHGNA